MFLPVAINDGLFGEKNESELEANHVFNPCFLNIF